MKLIKKRIPKMERRTDQSMLLELINSTQEELLLDKIPKFLEKHYSQDEVVGEFKDFVYAEGNIPIMLVAHLDTVQPEKPEIQFNYKTKTMWSPDGLGADDRAGVYSIMELIKRGYKPYVLFTTDEEIGCYGASWARKCLNIPDEVKYIIELDRRGSDDAVFYGNQNKNFQSYVETFGFKTAQGLLSDICEICPGWNISGVNLSIGYKNEHSNRETLSLEDMQNTIERVETMLNNPPEDRFPYSKPSGDYKQKKKKICEVDLHGTWEEWGVCSVNNLEVEIEIAGENFEMYNEPNDYPIPTYEQRREKEKKAAERRAKWNKKSKASQSMKAEIYKEIGMVLDDEDVFDVEEEEKIRNSIIKLMNS